jgi:hypothetical protein
MFLWLSIYALFAYPSGLPWEQYVPSALMAIVGAFLLSLQSEEEKGCPKYQEANLNNSYFFIINCE